MSLTKTTKAIPFEIIKSTYDKLEDWQKTDIQRQVSIVLSTMTYPRNTVNTYIPISNAEFYSTSAADLGATPNCDTNRRATFQIEYRRGEPRAVLIDISL